MGSGFWSRSLNVLFGTVRRHTLSRRRIIPLPQWKANPETDPEALFSKDQLVLALYPQTTCFYRALIHTPPHRVSPPPPPRAGTFNQNPQLQ